MTLDEAVEHCKDKIEELGCCECAKEHEQLLEWLKELKILRKEVFELKTYMKITGATLLRK